MDPSDRPEAPVGPILTERPTTILVVDDNENNRLLIRQLFDDLDLGYRVLEAADGARGLVLAETERPECILLDLRMPGLDGFEVLERLQRDPRTREIPVIILTATDDSLENMERALRGGAVDYIAKPISPWRVRVRVQGAIQRRRLLQQVQDLRASFTSMLVHDLRAPLTVIKGYLDLLDLGAGGTLAEKHERYLRKMQESCERMLRLIGEILDVSKLEAGKLTLRLQPLDLSALIAEARERLDPLARQKGIALEVRDADRRQPVVADPDRLDQVLMNLLGNALKFTPQGGTIALEVVDLGDEVEVAVRDSGPGIAPEELPLLFQPFSQTATGRSAGSAGTGLGLVVSRHLVEAHGGRIWAESEPGHGARFVFRLPRTHDTGRGAA